MDSTRMLVLGCVLLSLLSVVSAEGLLNLKCINTFTSDFIGPMWVGDVNGDGTLEVIVGTRVNGAVNAYKYKGYDCANEWGAVQSGGWNYASGGDVQSLYVGDIKGGKRVVVNGIESTFNKASKVSKYVTAITPMGSEDWNLKEKCGVAYTVYAADVDKSGVKNVMLGTKSSKVCVLKDNPVTKEPVLWTYVTERPVYLVKADDVDGDGNIEVIALDRQGYNTKLYCISDTGTLKWSYAVSGGVYLSSIADKLVSISDLDGDGKKEIILSTYTSGVQVVDSSGRLKWSFETKSSGSSNDLVSVVRTYDVNGDGKQEVLVGAKPNLYALDSSGGLLWKAPIDTMMYDVSVGDVFGDSSSEVVVSSTRYVYVFDNQGGLIDRWAYKVEIQGKESLFQEKDVNGYNVAVADLDGDGKNEIVTSFGWQEDRDIVTYYYGDLRVFEINGDFTPESGTTETTLPEEGDGGTGTTLSHETGTTLSNGPETSLPPDGKKGGICCIPLLPAILALALSAWLGYPIK